MKLWGAYCFPCFHYIIPKFFNLFPYRFIPIKNLIDAIIFQLTLQTVISSKAEQNMPKTMSTALVNPLPNWSKALQRACPAYTSMHNVFWRSPDAMTNVQGGARGRRFQGPPRTTERPHSRAPTVLQRTKTELKCGAKSGHPSWCPTSI